MVVVIFFIIYKEEMGDIPRLIIIASDSDAGALEFAQKVVKVLKVFSESKIKTEVVGAQQIFDSFVVEGYDDPSSEEAAKAYLKLRDAFPHIGPVNPALVNTRLIIRRLLREMGKDDVIIVTDVRDSAVADMLQETYNFERPFFLNTSQSLRCAEFQRRFRTVDKKDVQTYLYPFHGDRASMVEIDIGKREDLDLAVMEFVKKIWSRPPKGAEGGSLGGELHE